MAVETLPEPSTRVTPTSRSGFGFLTSGPIITTATICLTIIVVLAIMLDLFSGGPVGVDALAASVGMPRDTIEDVHEPFLLQRGFLVRTPRGRMTTAKAARHLDRSDPHGRGSHGQGRGPRKPSDDDDQSSLF